MPGNTKPTKDFSQQYCYEETDGFNLNISSSTLLDPDNLDDHDYVPDALDFSDFNETKLIEEPVDFINERKFVICETQLDKLLNRLFCPECADDTLSIKKTTSGTNVSVKIRCSNNHEVLDWFSQPQIGKMHSFNLLLCASIVFSGN